MNQQPKESAAIQKREVTIYLSDDDVYKSIGQLSAKILEEKKKILILCSADQIKQIDITLWNFGRNRFIPHITSLDEGFEFSRQPIIITDQENNLNQADYLIFTDLVPSNFITKFSRSFCFTSKASTKELVASKIGSSCELSYYKKENKKWLRQN